MLDRSRQRDRKFRRLVGAQLARLLADEPGADEAAFAENGNGNGNGADGAANGAVASSGEAGEQGDILEDIDGVLDEEDGGESPES